MSSIPLVSVVIPNYNHARYLPQRMESVLGQTFGDFEVIVLDDASTDDSVDVIRRYLTDPRTRLIINERNSGSPFVQWNRGVAEARGEYVWIAESDDYAEPGLLEALAPRLETDAAVGIAYCQATMVDEASVPIGSTSQATPDPARFAQPFVARGEEECGRYLIQMNTIPNASPVLFRRQVFLDAGGADTRMKLCGDWSTWVRMLLRSDLAYTPQCLSFFRVHQASVRSSTRMTTYIAERYSIAAEIARHVPVDRDLRMSLQAAWARDWVRALLGKDRIPLRFHRDVLADAIRFDRAVGWRLLCAALRLATARVGRAITSVSRRSNRC